MKVYLGQELNNFRRFFHYDNSLTLSDLHAILNYAGIKSLSDGKYDSDKLKSYRVYSPNVLYDAYNKLKSKKAEKEKEMKKEPVQLSLLFKEGKDMKKVIAESDLRNIIKECINKVLKESYRDWVTSSNISYKGKEIEDIYNECKRYLSIQDEWKLLHATDWVKFINRAKLVAEQLRFYSEKTSSSEDKVFLLKFSKQASRIQYPDLSVSSSSSFVDKAKDVRKSLSYILKLFGGCIDYFIDKHNNAEMRSQDIENDWNDFEKENNNRINDFKNRAEVRSFMRNHNSFNNNWKDALDRADIVANPNDDNIEYHNKIMNMGK